MDKKRHRHNWVEHKPDSPEYTIHLLWSEIEFDIKYGIVKRAKFAGIEGKAAKNYKFTDSDEDWMLRAVDNAVHAAKGRLGWACQHAGRFSSDELLENPDEYNLVFRFDGMKWLGKSDDLMSYIHTYITNSCIADWLEMAGSPEYTAIQNKADGALLQAEATMNHVILDNDPKFIL